MITLLCWLRNQAGATAIEYALIGGGIALAIVGALFLVGDDLEGLFNSMSSTMNSSAGKI